MADVSVAILGVGRIGASLGLALKRYNAQPNSKHKFRVTGFDTNSNTVKTAQKLNVFDDISNRAEDVARNKDIVILAMPYAETEATYQYIASDLRSGAVIVDFSPLKLPSIKWAEKHLPKEAHLIGATPLVNPKYLFEGVNETERATADFFDGGVLLLSPHLKAIPEAIELASDLATIIGATSQFVDPAESDTLIAATEGMPALMGMAFFHMMINRHGWNDAQRLTNPAFGMLTHHLFDTHPDDLRDLWLYNRDNMVHFIDDLMMTLRELRGVLASNDREAVEAALGTSTDKYELWFNRRVKTRWDYDPAMRKEQPAMPNVMSTLFGSFIANKLRPRDEEKD